MARNRPRVLSNRNNDYHQNIVRFDGMRIRFDDFKRMERTGGVHFFVEGRRRRYVVGGLEIPYEAFMKAFSQSRITGDYVDIEE